MPMLAVAALLLLVALGRVATAPVPEAATQNTREAHAFLGALSDTRDVNKDHRVAHAAPVDRAQPASMPVSEEELPDAKPRGKASADGVAERDTSDYKDRLGATRAAPDNAASLSLSETARRSRAPDATVDSTVSSEDATLNSTTSKDALAVVSRQRNHTAGNKGDGTEQRLLLHVHLVPNDSIASHSSGLTQILWGFPRRLKAAVVRAANVVSQRLRSSPGVRADNISAGGTTAQIRLRRGNPEFLRGKSSRSVPELSETATDLRFMAVAGAVALATSIVVVILGMAHRRQAQGSAATGELHVAASEVDMFGDRFKPTLFTMQQWTELRDNLFYAGLTHRTDSNHARHALFKVAKALNLIQQHYVFRPGTPDAGLTVVCLKGRLLAEVSVRFLLSPASLSSLKATSKLWEKINALERDGAHEELVRDLNLLRNHGNKHAAHDTDDFKPAVKSEVADAAFRVSRKVWASAVGRFPDVVPEAAAGAAAAANAAAAVSGPAVFPAEMHPALVLALYEFCVAGPSLAALHNLGAVEARDLDGVSEVELKRAGVHPRVAHRIVRALLPALGIGQASAEHWRDEEADYTDDNDVKTLPAWVTAALVDDASLARAARLQPTAGPSPLVVRAMKEWKLTDEEQRALANAAFAVASDFEDVTDDELATLGIRPLRRRTILRDRDRLPDLAALIASEELARRAALERAQQLRQQAEERRRQESEKIRLKKEALERQLRLKEEQRQLERRLKEERRQRELQLEEEQRLRNELEERKRVQREKEARALLKQKAREQKEMEKAEKAKAAQELAEERHAERERLSKRNRAIAQTVASVLNEEHTARQHMRDVAFVELQSRKGCCTCLLACCSTCCSTGVVVCLWALFLVPFWLTMLVWHTINGTESFGFVRPTFIGWTWSIFQRHFVAALNFCTCYICGGDEDDGPCDGAGVLCWMSFCGLVMIPAIFAYLGLLLVFLFAGLSLELLIEITVRLVYAIYPTVEQQSDLFHGLQAGLACCVYDESAEIDGYLAAEENIAADYFEKRLRSNFSAAANGDLHAVFSLAQSYAGKGARRDVRRDDRLALRLYQLAAEHGHANAQSELHRLLVQGGVQSQTAAPSNTGSNASTPLIK